MFLEPSGSQGTVLLYPPGFNYILSHIDPDFEMSKRKIFHIYTVRSKLSEWNVIKLAGQILAQNFSQKLVIGFWMFVTFFLKTCKFWSKVQSGSFNNLIICLLNRFIFQTIFYSPFTYVKPRNIFYIFGRNWTTSVSLFLFCFCGSKQEY